MHKKISYGGMGCALCIILLAMSSYLPTLKAATLFLASVLSYVISFVCGVKTAFAMYAAASILAFFVCRSGTGGIVFSYIICFGNFPIFKFVLDKKPPAMRYASKLFLYTAYFAAVYFTFTKILSVPILLSPVILFVLGMGIFAFYDCLVLQTGRYVINLLRK